MGKDRLALSIELLGMFRHGGTESLMTMHAHQQICRRCVDSHRISCLFAGLFTKSLPGGESKCVLQDLQDDYSSP